jgi:hypothetical protein
MGEVIAAGGKSSYDPEIIAKFQNMLDQQQIKQRNVNVVFVIDGTASMGPYFPAVAKAVKLSIKRLQTSQNTFRFGAVVYRDWAEGRKRLTELSPLGNDVATFLTNVQAGDINDMDTPEALYYGLNDALRGIGFTNKETNILILIGDAGNHSRNDGSAVSESALVKELSRQMAHLCVFQVHHGNHSSYADFVDQTKRLIMKTAEINYIQNKEIAGVLGSEYNAPKWNQIGTKYHLQGSSFYGRVFGMTPGLTMNTTELTEMVKSFIEYVNLRNNTLIQKVEEIKFGERTPALEESDYTPVVHSEFASPLAPGIVEFLRQAGLTEEQLKLAQSEKYQIYLDAVTTLHVSGQQHPLFKKVLFLSRRELGDLVNTMFELTDQSSAAGLREAFAKNWIKIMERLLGGINEDDLMNEPYDRLVEMALNIPSSSNLLKDLTLREILEATGEVEDKFGQYYNTIAENARELGRIFNTDDDYRESFRSNEVRYFWVPADLLP